MEPKQSGEVWATPGARPRPTGGNGGKADGSGENAPSLGFHAPFEGAQTPWNAGAREVRYRRERHLLTVGPNGSGKGTRLLVPALTLDRSMLVIDPKGELAAITARRRAQFGPVIVLNPFGLLLDKRAHLKSHGFNPMAALDPTSDNYVDDAMGLAEALVRVEGNDPHWSASAQDLIAALIMQARRWDEHATLGDVRRMLCEATEMGEDEDEHAVPVKGFRVTASEMASSDYPPIAAKAGRFVNESREIDSIVSTAATQTRFLDSRPIQRDLTGPAIDFAAMKRQTVTIFVILPANRLQTHSGWLRLIIVSALRALMETPANRKRPPVLMILDEMAQLGYLPTIENAMGIARGYGIQLWPILQDLSQLKALYNERWQTFLGNAGVLTAFTPQDLFTAKHLSERAGQMERETESKGHSMGGDGRLNISVNAGMQWVPKFRPEELMGLVPGKTMCFFEHVSNPLFTYAPQYFEAERLRQIDPEGLLDSNPYYVMDD